MSEKRKPPRDRDWTNAIADLMRESADLDGSRIEFKPAIEGEDAIQVNKEGKQVHAPAYVLRLGMSMKHLAREKRHLLQAREMERHRTEARFKSNELLVDINLRLDAFSYLYFTELAIICNQWKEAPVFSIRQGGVVVVNKRDFSAYSALAVKATYQEQELRQFFQRLALSPFSKVH